MKKNIEEMAISEFKATCLAVLERVRQTGQPITVTRRGKPIAQVIPPPAEDTGAKWMGAMAKRVQAVGDVVAPVAGAETWETLRS